MISLEWARQSRRHVGHVIAGGFARPCHGEFPASKSVDREYNTACGKTIEVAERRASHDGWKYCNACLTEIGRLIEQAMGDA